MTARIIRLADHKPSPWTPRHQGCDCAACYIRGMGADLDRMLTDTGDLMSDQADAAMRHMLDQLGELCGVACQYERPEEQ